MRVIASLVGVVFLNTTVIASGKTNVQTLLLGEGQWFD